MWDLIVSVPDHCLSFYSDHEWEMLLENSNKKSVCVCSWGGGCGGGRGDENGI